MPRPIEPDDSELSLAAADPYMRLAVGVLRTAVLDVKTGNRRAAEAAEWLASPDVLPFLEIIGINHDRVIDWLNKHFRSDILQ